MKTSELPRAGLVAAGAILAAVVAMPAEAGLFSMKARADIISCFDGETIGWAKVKEFNSAEGVKNNLIVISVEGLEKDAEGKESPAGKHAVHIHETAACKPCSAAGGHFDPGPFGFTNPDGNHPFHSGDLINIKVDDEGKGFLFAETSRVTLSNGPLSLFDDDGSAFIIHVNPDTYCPKGAEGGCAGGGRAACGIIEHD